MKLRRAVAVLAGVVALVGTAAVGVGVDAGLAAAASAAEPVVITYDLKGKGNRTDLEAFGQLAAETLGSPYGWSMGGAIVFERVSDASDFTLWLSAAEHVSTFGPPCGDTYSCSFGRNVAVNETRWLESTPAWTAGGGTLRDYRHMVVNHEVGHWLELDHVDCDGQGQLAPIMQQQSIDLQGCRANPWPLPRERADVARARGVVDRTPPSTAPPATSAPAGAAGDAERSSITDGGDDASAGGGVGRLVLLGLGALTIGGVGVFVLRRQVGPVPITAESAALLGRAPPPPKPD